MKKLFMIPILLILLIAAVFGARVFKVVHLEHSGDQYLPLWKRLQAESLGSSKLRYVHVRWQASEDPLASAQAYQKLQMLIAEKFPQELDRPSFELHFSGESEENIVLIGGVGPLSDASVVNKLSQIGGTWSRNLRLISSPPPREPLDLLWDGLPYLWNLRSFLRDSDYFMVASNTAHAHRVKLKALAPGSRLVDLTELVVSKIKEEQIPSPLLILGTQSAWNKNFYEGKFDREGIAYQKLDLEEQKEIQLAISKIKASQFSDTESENLKNFVGNLKEKYGAQSLLLACTELSLVLKPGAGEFDQRKFIDSERILVNSLYAYLSGMTPPGQM